MNLCDMSDAKFQANPYPYYSEMRSEAAAVRVDPGNMWAVTRFEDVDKVLRNPDIFSSARSTDDPDNLFEKAFGGQVIIGTDNPAHKRVRSIMQKRFRPKQLSKMQDRVEEITKNLLAEVRDQAAFDLVPTFSVPLPVIVIAELLGVPNHKIEEFKRWSNALVTIVNSTSGSEKEAALAEVMALGQYFAESADQRRTDPSEDFIGMLVNAESEPGKITPGEIIANCAFLLVAGNETTTNLLGGMVKTLYDHPEQLALLRDNPDLIDNTIEESLRYCSPVQGLFRRATKDVELGGVKIKKGEQVWACYAAANRDPGHFPDPDKFDITREGNTHIAFGWGQHFCLGANLARRESRTALKQLLPILDDYHLETPIDWLPSWFLRGPAHLRLKRNN
ncbi:MAG: cytochrome P450 [Pseudomonadales bacterium]|nr:cytochrome P450 [Pseudomonadales bacterium]